MESVIEKFSTKPKIATKKSFTVALEKEKKENDRNDELVEIDVLNYQEQKEKEEETEKPIIIDQTSIITKEDKSKYQKIRHSETPKVNSKKRTYLLFYSNVLLVIIFFKIKIGYLSLCFSQV